MNQNKPSPKQEKNRHHLVTFVCALVALGLLLLLWSMLGARHHVVWMSGILYVVVLGVRTVFVELGIRRHVRSVR